MTLVACNREPPPARPVFDQIRDSLRREDYGAVYDLLAAGEKERRERATAAMREEMGRTDADPALAEKYRRMAKAFEVTVAGLRTMSSRELFARGTAVKTASGLKTWAEAELIGEPRIEGDHCLLTVRLPRNRTGAMRLVLEDGAWRLVLR